MHNQYRGPDFSYERIKRYLAGLVAIILWCLSIKFSVGGFGAGIDNKEIWIGWLLGFSITVIQLVWNGLKDKTNLTLFVLGLSAYFYGIYTNVAGIIDWRGDTLQSIYDNPVSVLFPLILGLFLEIAPEPLFVWAFTTRLDEGDFLGNLLNSTSSHEHHAPSRLSMTAQTPPGANRLQQQYRPVVNGGNKAGNNNNNKHHNNRPQFDKVRRDE